MNDFRHVQTIPEMLSLFGISEQILHPQVSVIDFGKLGHHIDDGSKLSAGFYAVLFKHYSKTNLRYGRKLVDFQDGSLLCLSPNQVIEMDNDIDETAAMRGWGLFFHPDFIRNTPLGQTIRDYGFFSYEVTEALHLSEKEKQILHDCVLRIDAELHENIDIHSQQIIVSSIEVLLNYCSRFYARQFITRKSSHHSVIAEVDKILTDYFRGDKIAEQGLPTVKYLADQVHLSAGYLSDLLKKETGRNTQDHIHYHLIEEAKNILLNTNRSIGEVAYALGFEYPQYFNKLFKQKTGKTPLEFRNLN